MKIAYASRKIEKICTDAAKARKELGVEAAAVLQKRLRQMTKAENLEELRADAGHWHELKGDRKGQLACSLSGRLRLIFIPGHSPIPKKPDGGLDWHQVTAVMNLEIADYHET